MTFPRAGAPAQASPSGSLPVLATNPPSGSRSGPPRGEFRRRGRLRTGVLVAVLFTALVGAAAAPGVATPGRGEDVGPPIGPSDPASCAPSPGWAPSAHHRTESGTFHAYTGNGYLGTRVPPSGGGYAETGGRTGWPLFTPGYDGAFVSGLYGRGPEVTAGRQVLAALPSWTGLDLTVDGETYGAVTPQARISHYRQTLFLRCGFVRTSLTWATADGRRTDLVLDVLTSRDDPHTGAVRLRMTPHWDGRATVTDRIDGRGARRLIPAKARDIGGGGPGTVTIPFRTTSAPLKANKARQTNKAKQTQEATNKAMKAQEAQESKQTQKTRSATRKAQKGETGALSSTLRAPGRTAGPMTEAGGPTTRAGTSLSARQSSTFAVRAGRTYEAAKYVGVDTSLTARSPVAAATAASLRAADRGWPALFAAHTAAWRALWSSDVEVPGRPDLQLWSRASQYGLLSATRKGSGDSVGPAGLSSDNYAGLIFWDAETWMFPALLATRPELARTVLEYRYRTRSAARANAHKLGFQGLFYPWTSAGHGEIWSECHSWRPPHCVTQNHLQSDIALAAWQYWLTTGDKAWLRERGWPLLKGIAEFWADRATRNPDGSYSVDEVAGPDEYSNGVDDGVFTNAGAATALRDASLAARALGRTAPDAWQTVADGLRIPYDPKRKIFLQYAGYADTKIKQADTVMLLYPLEWPMPAGAAAATLDHYAALTDPEGPAMTDSVHAVDAAAIGEPGCATYTYLQRSIRPFVRGPFGLFSEARGDKAGADDPLSGMPAQDFVTGKGGFLQVFTHGLTGSRPRQGAVHLDPTLPPQLRRGVTVRGLRLHSSTYDIAIGPATTRVTLTGGPPFKVESPDRRERFTVDASSPAVLRTRRPDLAPTSNAARCRPVSATSEEPGLYAEAAVDGSTTTAWSPAADRASLTVDMGAPARRFRAVTPKWGVAPASYSVETSTDRHTWTEAPDNAPTQPARYVRLTVRTSGPKGPAPALREVTVTAPVQ
nr:discoidin domain-containing protein [Streptomyces tsukubensis]